MFVKYGTLKLISEAMIDLIQLLNAEYGFLFTLGFYIKEVKVEYFSKHEDSMETQLVELVHT
jgi:hypothetical protein